MDALAIILTVMILGGLLCCGFIVAVILEKIVAAIPDRFKTIRFILSRSVVGAAIIITIFSVQSQLSKEDRGIARASITTLYIKFTYALELEAYQEAFEFMVPHYQRTHTLQDFRNDFDYVKEWGLHPQHSLSISGNTAELYPRNANVSGLWSGPIFHFERVSGTWYFSDTHDWVLD
jgi:hypothetical protein